MGVVNNNYCDNCGDSIGQATLADAIQVTALGTNGTPTVMFLCMKPVYAPRSTESSEETPVLPVPKITGCARKFLTEAMLSRLYKDVRDYIGDDKAKPFSL